MYLFLTYLNFTHWLEEHMLSCPSKKFLHIECPGCGFQRSCIALMEGRLHSSFSLYPATGPILIMLVFTMLHLKFKFLYGAAIIKYFQLSIAIVIVVFYIYKIIHLKIIA